MSEQDEELAALAKALGHPVRVQILRILKERAGCVRGELDEGLPVAQTTVWQHLRVLKQAGLVRGELDGPQLCYCLDATAVSRLRELLDDF